MSDLAKLECALREDSAFAQLATSHSHRAVREDSLGFIVGRDALLADWVASGTQPLSITADLGEMIAFVVGAQGQSWRGHRWVEREDDLILREVVVEDRLHERVAPAGHPPLGELRAGTGQYAAGDCAILPPGFPAAAKALADRMHRAWNGRAFDLYRADWLSALVAELPDATFYFERAIVAGEQIALLWRVHGHGANGQRIRLIGSSLFSNGGSNDETIVDVAAMRAQASRELIDYSQTA